MRRGMSTYAVYLDAKRVQGLSKLQRARDRRINRHGAWQERPRAPWAVYVAVYVAVNAVWLPRP